MLQPQPVQAAKILIVEDSPTQAKLLEQVLVAHGYHVFGTSNGRKALDHIIGYHPDLVISDILMPEMDGFELCRQIRRIEAFKCLPIILLTNMNNPADVLYSLEAGADYFITKPYNNTQLLSRISTTLKRGNIYHVDGSCGEATLTYRGQNHSINAPKAQIIELLLATYELAAEKNQELLKAKQELSELNQQLELKVSERTAALVVETAERVRAVEELRKNDAIMMQQGRQAAMGEMIGNIAHQWRQPLNTLGLSIQQLKLYYKLGKFTEEFLNQSVTSSMNLIQHMSKTIEDFKNYFKPEKEKVEFNIREVVESTLSLVKDSFKSKNIDLEVVANGDPSIYGFRNEFAQVLLNIFNNAGDVLAERACEDSKITIIFGSEEKCTVITIADNAGGIPEESINKIFDPYFTTKGPELGTGIGLFMSKAIIEKNMGGKLTVQNIAGGAEFRIEVCNGING